MKSLIIVESPTKAKTIKKFLPKSITVDSCNGHIRDLPASAREIPAKLKKNKWATLGIDVDNDYEPLYVISPQKKKTVTRLKKLIKEADELILATDEDREGEGISWHIMDELNPRIPVKRMVFHEITQEAIEQALKDFREINMNLVHAQEARRIIDRLAGYTISPLLWKKIGPGLSAGRVQSVAVQLLVNRERERMRFRSGSYWDLKAVLKTSDEAGARKFEAEMTHLNDKRLAGGKDFSEATGKLKNPGKVTLLGKEEAEGLREELLAGRWHVQSIEKRPQKKSPAPPFITSTLQQEANRKFGYSARDTMRIAQKLYEEGYITYMRTDSTNLSNQAVEAARSAVERMYGKEYLSDGVRKYAGKSKGAQEAHEAIRPAGSSFRTPSDTVLSGREAKLYDLIWKRTMATQMAEARMEFTNVQILAESDQSKAIFKAGGKKILFPGFFRAYVEGSDDPDVTLEDRESVLPELQQDQEVVCREVKPLEHETKPPARFTEASLVKQLEKDGVGRPSTYATIIGTIMERDYVRKEGNALVPTFTAFAVTELLEKYFSDLVDEQFTSEMEQRLDDIATGKENRLQYLKSYYEGEKGLKTMVENQESKIDPQEARHIDLPVDGLNGMKVFLGRFGPYVQKKSEDGEEVMSSIPESLAPSDITVEKLQELVSQSKKGPESLGKHPETGEEIFVLSGRFGPYVQLGETPEGGDKKKKGAAPKPKRVSLLKGMKPEEVDFDTAVRLLSLPRSLGEHPETGKEVKAGIGRFGPYVVHDGVFQSLTATDNVLDVELGRAVELLKQKSMKKGRATSSVIKDMGEHPEHGEKIQIMTGRYGPYIKYGKKNISIPKGKDPESMDMGAVLDLIKQKVG
ncbi:type I DNA topoisomerase [Balneolales bacterium ANBcel1]|nr:type I DNA topoisomerase [Balneolales bacterium ANBcel1]